MIFTKKKNQSGFTLIELLLVVAIIGLMASIAAVALASARAKGRDGRRLHDMNQVKSGLDLFFSSATGYPDVSLWNSGTLSCAGVDYLDVPEDPVGANYVYQTQGQSFASPVCAGQTVWSEYKFQFQTEQPSNLGDPGTWCLQASGVTSGTCP